MAESAAHSIFISYRRADTALLAELIAERLGERFEVFVDVETIELGEAFMARIQRGLAAADVVLVLLGPNWDAARLHEPGDVVANELRVARQFGRRVLPVVVEPAGMPARESLPPDLEWIAGLNAFFLPEPPRHRVAMAQLADVIGKSTTRAATANARPVFAVPSDAEMLKVGRGNIKFSRRELATPQDAGEPPELCKVDPRLGWAWVASWHSVETYDLGDGSLAVRDTTGAEWLQPIAGGAIAGRSTSGYDSPDNVHFTRLDVAHDRLERSRVGHTVYWGMPPVALSPDETVIATCLDDTRGDLVLLSTADGDEMGRCTSAVKVNSLCFDKDGTRLYVLGSGEGGWELSAFDVESGSERWTTELASDLADDSVSTDPRERFKDRQSRRRAHQVACWPACESLLVSTGSRVVEVDAGSGDPRRALVAADGRVHCLATDPSTSLACIGDRRELLIWGPDAVAVASVEHRGDRCVDCSVVDGRVAALIGSDDARWLLTAAGLTVERDGSVGQQL